MFFPSTAVPKGARPPLAWRHVGQRDFKLHQTWRKLRWCAPLQNAHLGRCNVSQCFFLPGGLSGCNCLQVLIGVFLAIYLKAPPCSSQAALLMCHGERLQRPIQSFLLACCRYRTSTISPARVQSFRFLLLSRSKCCTLCPSCSVLSRRSQTKLPSFRRRVCLVPSCRYLTFAVTKPYKGSLQVV